MSEFSANKGLGRTAAICRDAPEYYQTGPRVTTCEIADPLEATQPMTPVEQINTAIQGALLHCINQNYARLEQRMHAAISVAGGAELDKLCGISFRPAGITDQQLRDATIHGTAYDFRDNRPRGHLTQTERDVQDLDPWAGLDR